MKDMNKEDLIRRIAELPDGSVTERKENGKTYYYHSRTIKDSHGRPMKTERYISDEDASSLRAKIEERKELEKQLKTR